ncbi:hypothetical protein Q9L58_010233 [Maublancomyces gigas]|uniref:Endonuclease/exonuclease/phosphatase domain-containing protein n=1 Tax=Discina gigas TaxID=1032678 RepID=A0ABR3G537_9PEZI
MLLPSTTNSKCATYVKKNLRFSPRITTTLEDCILGKAVTIQGTAMEFINISAPNKTETQKFLRNHKPLSDCKIAGDFNTHHPDWYSDLAPSRTGGIRASSRSAEFLVDWKSSLQFLLLNTASKPTHYPRNGYQTTIPDLIFARNHDLTLIQGWACDESEGGDSDHALITTTLNIKLPTFIPKRQHDLTDWELFRHHISKLQLKKEDDSTVELTIAAAKKIDKQIQDAINLPATAKRIARAELNVVEYKENHKVAAAKWRKAIRRAQWQYSEDTFQKADRTMAFKRVRVHQQKFTCAPRASKAFRRAGRTGFTWWNCALLLQGLPETSTRTQDELAASTRAPSGGRLGEEMLAGLPLGMKKYSTLGRQSHESR